MAKINSLVLRTAGVNCDCETVRALKIAGSDKVNLLHINQLKKEKQLFRKYDFIVLPGGFSYGDTISAGIILANEIKFIFKKEISDFLKKGKLLMGICNGFQVLVKSGILSDNREFQQSYSLIRNDSGRFECRWIYLKINKNSFWTKKLPDIITLPIAHGEGKFVTKDQDSLSALAREGKVIFQYCNKNGDARVKTYPDNPNGSSYNIAGITSRAGQILGMMPHPERFSLIFHYPFWTALKANNKGVMPFGLQIFKNAIDELKKRK